MSDTLIVGAGQAGLAVAYHLSRLGEPVRIIAADRRIGDTWRERWDSLRLFTPAFYNALPGMPFPADDPDHLPLKDEVAAYLETYADGLDVPIQLDTRVQKVRPDGGAARLSLDTDDGPLQARNVILATGAFRTPRIPPFAEHLDPSIARVHSAGYQNPETLPAGDVLVVGAGNSGIQIAAELARARSSDTVWLSGPDTGRLPRRLLGRDIYRWLGPTLLRARRDSWFGRRLHGKMTSGGDPVFRPAHQAMIDAGVRRVGRTTGVDAGRPVVEDEGALNVEVVVWCTGFRNEYPWLEAPGALDDGGPVHERGVSPVPGLYFLGLRYLYRPDSSLINGVGEDAAFLAERIAADG